MQQKKVYVMMSGGVDSSVAASLLKEQGYSIKGVFMKCWSLEQLTKLGASEDLYGCFWEDDAKDAEIVAKRLGIEFEIWDFEEVYRQKVVDYMLTEYKLGLTPNPDVMCNSTIKFGVFYDKAMFLGADFVATGHYARIVSPDNLPSKKLIARALDTNKDQSYFLWGLSRDRLNKTLFPIGEFASKLEVRRYAESKNLITASKPDSQGLCFIGQTPLRELLLQTLGSKTGNIVDFQGKILGQQNGAFLYTIGQREKLGLSCGPWFVSEVDVDNNIVRVAHYSQQNDIFSQTCQVKNLNLFVGLEQLLDSNTLEAQIRYRQQPEKCQIKKNTENHNVYEVKFEKLVRAVAKGQGIVFYYDQLMLGGGVIC